MNTRKTVCPVCGERNWLQIDSLGLHWTTDGRIVRECWDAVPIESLSKGELCQVIRNLKGEVSL